jgi:drug/metabolite transporter (DMT)-like permease
LILEGIAFGLLSAIALGVGDLSAGLLARRLGTLRVAAGELLVSVLLLLALLAIAGLGLPTEPRWTVWIAAVAALRAFGYFALLRAFSLGPVAVVGPVVAGNSAVTVIAAVILLGDRPSPVQYLAVLMATIGSILIVLVVDRPARRFRAVGLGPLIAIVAMVCLATVVAAQQPPIREVGWLPTIAFRRLVEALITWTLVGVGWFVAPELLGLRQSRPVVDPIVAMDSSSRRVVPTWRPRTSRALLAIGAIDTIGLSSLAVALDVAPAWLFGVVGSIGPAVALSYGMVVLGERLRPTQWLGIALILASLVLVAIG